MKVIKKVLNFITYVGCLCFLMSTMVIGPLGVKMVLAFIPIYFPGAKESNLIEWVLWGSCMFVIFMTQQFIYTVWKKYVKLS